MSRIGDVITTFVDKASCLVETESFNVVEAVESKGRHVDVMQLYTMHTYNIS